MKEIEQYLVEAYRDRDDAIVSLEMDLSLGNLRSNIELLKKINPSRLRVRSARLGSVIKGTDRNSSVVKQSHRVKRQEVLTAIANNCASAPAIAAAIGANTTQVTKALSRYAKVGVIRRVQPGRYELSAATAGKAKPNPKKRKPKTSTIKPTQSKAAAKRGKTARVTQAAVLAALRSKNRTPQSIANALNVNPAQVTKALSRYTQQGLIVRTRPGHYALKK